jgi:hypothetical protein
MNRASNQEMWCPQSAEERDTVLRELQSIVDSPYFCNSKRYPALLRYVVENALAGRADLLKERALGIEVFDRPATYDTNADTVVRFTAGEVRKRLLLYYSNHPPSGIRIALPPGSYVPEFLLDPERQDEGRGTVLREIAPATKTDRAVPEVPHFAVTDLDAPTLQSPIGPAQDDGAASGSPRLYFGKAAPRHGLFIAGAAVIVTVVLTVAGIRWWPRSPDRVLNDFWAPLLSDQRVIPVCIGGVVFQQNAFSGVITAGKDSDYPFVSMQAASAVAQVSALIDHTGGVAKLLPAPTTLISDLREHPVVLIGAYNNQWTMRLLQPIRFHFTMEPVESIVDQTQPQVHWSRDRSRPYGSTDDYALIARFRDATTGEWVIALSGLGRNGTEAAAQFATSPHAMQELEKRLGIGFLRDQNIEAVLKVRVIDGKTGAPTIEAVHMW